MLVNINGLKKDVESNLTILQACESQGVTIPHFCYHDKLSIAGNCRMCLVEDSKSLKPLAACAVNINSNMQIFTNTELVKKARESVLEFLLANHPLDCPICDQGGECDLQDQSLVFGGDRGRFYENKRAVEDKNFGPLIKTIMTRCIHCTRCVRFADEIAGTSSLGMTGRGSKSEIGFYIEKILNSEVSGNIIDLCPVGALTSKPYAFTARSWELQSFESIDFFDAINSNIRVDTRGAKIMRILPRINSNLNEDWISDKIRFVYDSLQYQRLTSPMIKKDNTFIKISWKQAFAEIKNVLNKQENIEIIGTTGPFTDVESAGALKMLVHSLGSSNLNNTELSFKNVNVDFTSNYKFNFSNADIKDSDFCLILGADIRLEAPILNIKLRKLFLKGTNIYNFGFNTNSNYYIKQLGNNTKTLLQILEGTHWLCNKLIKAKKPIIILGSSFLERNDNIQNLIPFFKNLSMRDNWNGFGVLPTSSSFINCSEIGFIPGVHSSFMKSSPKLNIILGHSLENLKRKDEDFIVYIGHHGDSSINKANIILPSASPFEKVGSYINVFGDLQKTNAIFYGLNNIKCDWEILENLMTFLHKKDIISKDLFLSKINLSLKPNTLDKLKDLTLKNKINNTLLQSSITNFYKTDAMSSASKILNKCSISFDDSLNTFKN